MRSVMESMSSNAQGEDAARKEITRLFGEKSERQSELSHCDTVLSMLSEAAAEQEQQAESRAAELYKAQERHNELEAQLQSEKRILSEAEDKVNGLNNVIEGYALRIQGRETKVKTLDEQKTKLTIELNSASSRISMLSEMEKDFEGYSKAVKIVMRESEHGTLKGIHGPVANLVKTDDRYALAIETALGGSMQSIVVDTQEQGKAAIEMLKRKDGGRATFLPINTIKPAELKRRPEGEPGFLGTALELSGFDKRFDNIFSNLLARTVVAETLSDAVGMSKRYDNQLRIVTLDGQLINAGGSMTGGSTAKNAGILSRANELKALQEKQENLSAKAKDCAAKLSEAERELASARYELQTADFELKEASEALRQSRSAAENTEFLLGEAAKTVTAMEHDGQNAASRKAENTKRAEETKKDAKRLTEEIARLNEALSKRSAQGEEYDRLGRELSEKLTAITEKRSSLTSESDTTISAIAQLQELFADLSGDGETRRLAIENLSAENGSLLAQIEQKASILDQNRTKAESIKSELTAINNLKLELEGKRTQNEKSAQEKNRELLDIERLCSAFEQKKLAADMEEKQIIDKLWDSYELSRTAAQAVREPVESMSASTKRISALKREISALGNPNLGAIEEYERVSERYNFLTEQRDDVEKAKRELEKIITDITKEMKDIFLREFKVIDESFRKTFLELFGGGRAALILEDEEDVLNCGIEIKIQPPGKALSTLSLLSGGEKAFVAIALYFAIIKVRPTPFCVMDEIEAALDEANVDRYAHYMRGMASKTQFIVITHRRGTMEEADMLYGVTMQEKGVTEVLSVDLEEAEKTLVKA